LPGTRTATAFPEQAKLNDWSPLPTLTTTSTSLPSGLRKATFATPRVPAGERLVTRVPDKASVDVMMGHTFEMNRLHPDYYAAWLGNHVLGGGVSGREDHRE
jgi:hypothetical protein